MLTRPAPLAWLVEDDAVIIRCLRAELEAHGWRVAQASTVEAAWRDPAIWQCDLVLLDLGLPGLDGVAFIAALRQRAALPVIVLGARVDDATVRRALAAGADDYLSKLLGTGWRLRAALRRLDPRRLDPRRVDPRPTRVPG